MWIFTNSGFLSVVAHRDNKEVLLVRARRAGEIESIFPKAETFKMESADYHYRAEIKRDEVAQVMAEQIQNIEYDNFKSSVNDNKRHDAYMGVWSVMYAYQATMAG